MGELDAPDSLPEPPPKRARVIAEHDESSSTTDLADLTAVVMETVKTHAAEGQRCIRANDFASSLVAYRKAV
eukprot:1178521-Prymnesium_polylepis.1